MRLAVCGLLCVGLAHANGLSPEPLPAQALQEAEDHIRELQRLHATDALLEVQLRIAKKMRACQDTGYPCPAATLAPTPTLPIPTPKAPVSEPAFPVAQLLATYQGRAHLRLDDGQHIEVQAGQRLGFWKVHKVDLDFVQLQDAQGRMLRIPVQASTDE